MRRSINIEERQGKLSNSGDCSQVTISIEINLSKADKALVDAGNNEI